MIKRIMSLIFAIILISLVSSLPTNITLQTIPGAGVTIKPYILSGEEYNILEQKTGTANEQGSYSVITEIPEGKFGIFVYIYHGERKIANKEFTSRYTAGENVVETYIPQLYEGISFIPNVSKVSEESQPEIIPQNIVQEPTITGKVIENKTSEESSSILNKKNVYIILEIIGGLIGLVILWFIITIIFNAVKTNLGVKRNVQSRISSIVKKIELEKVRKNKRKEIIKDYQESIK